MIRGRFVKSQPGTLREHFLLLVRPSIGQTLSSRPLNRFVCPVLIVNAKRNAVAVAEVEFRQVAVQMLLRAVLINALHAALENAVKYIIADLKDPWTTET